MQGRVHPLRRFRTLARNSRLFVAVRIPMRTFLRSMICTLSTHAVLPRWNGLVPIYSATVLEIRSSCQWTYRLGRTTFWVLGTA